MAIGAAGEKVVILGGGFGALAAAYELSDPALPQEYDITLYQLGWRLGGKGASGRGPNDRIEEHGIHVFFGCYDNAFYLLQRCYDELGRGPHEPLPTWKDAFQQHDRIAFMDNVDGEWKPWAMSFPRLPGEPGVGHPPASPWAVLKAMLAWMRQQMELYGEDLAADHPGAPALPHWWDALEAEHGGGAGQSLTSRLSHVAHSLAESLHEDPAEHSAEKHHQLSEILRHLSARLTRPARQAQAPTPDEGPSLHHIWLFVQYLTAIVRGILGDGLIFHSFTKINDEDYCDWLGRHGASEEVQDSAMVRAFYDLVFAFPMGDKRAKGDLEAGSMLNMFFQAWHYHGSILWKMMAGMGDVVFAPLYEVLHRRGVKFEFFHKVTGLELDAGGTRLQRVTIVPQVNLAKGRDEYEPLTDVGGLPCWLDHPTYEQLEEGDALRDGGYDLESFWTTWVDRGEAFTLEADRDFAKLILGIPPAALPTLCPELLRRDARWNAMVEKVTTVQTQALQLWFAPDLVGLGWTLGSAVTGCYDASNLDSWADMSQVKDLEGWKKGEVGNISYLCGALAGPAFPPDPSETDFPKKVGSAVRDTALHFLQAQTGPLWPKTVGSDGFRWEMLVAPQTERGAGRLASQYVRANLSPSERYVQTPRGSSRHRLRSDHSGYPNLYLAGDWTWNGLNLGCIEAAAISGRQVARAISGADFEIPREKPL